MAKDLNMEKNKNYPVNQVSRAVNNDRTKDTSKFNRNGRGRGCFPIKQENHQNKKVSPQKFHKGGFDRRFRTRSWNNFSSDRNSSQEVKNEPEVGSVQNPGSKKGGSNASHLLNFTFSSNRDVSLLHARHEHGWRMGRRKHFNKEQFLQANFKFVVKSCGDYTVHQADPDVLVDWSLVEEVQLPCFEEPKCPICLEFPSATKLTRCGHFYCWPCILHYLALSDKSYRKCPICDEVVRKDDLKSVVFLPKKSYSADEEITMELMYKERGTVQAIPVHMEHLYANGLPTLEEGYEKLPFIKLFTASTEQVLDIVLRREEDDLNVMLREDGDSPESCFIHEALELLNSRKEENLISRFSYDVGEAISASHDSSQEYFAAKPANFTASNQVNYVDAFENLKISDDETHLQRSSGRGETMEEIKSEQIQILQDKEYAGKIQDFPTSRNRQTPKDVYYFYQATDGQPIYLHPLNVKMLIEEYGSLKACPDKITAKIIQTEGNTMNETLRSKFRYLNHLPLHCEYVLVELKFNNVVSKKTYDKFSQEVKKRKFLRQNKKKVERRWELKVEHNENMKKGLFPSASVDLGSLKQFPSCNEAAVDAHLSGSSTSPALSSENDISSTCCFNDSSAQTSFAQMLREGKVKKTSVGPGDLTPANSRPQASGDSDDDDDDGSHSVPNYNQSFCYDIPTFINHSEERNIQGQASNKKKKSKKKILFSTNMNRTK